MPLFKKISQIAQYIPISDTISDTNVPKQFTAEQQFILPILGKDLLATLQTEADTIPPSPSAILQKVWQALAYLVYFKNAPYLHTRISESGFKNVTNDKIQGAYRYQYNDIKNNLEADGMTALEDLFNFLLENKDDYPDWTASDAYIRLNKNLIKSGSQFAAYYTISQPNRTFNALQPVLQEVEDMFIIPSIGRDFFEYLRDVAAPTNKEKEVLDLLRKAVANLTIHKAISKLTVAVKPEGLTVMLTAGVDAVSPGETNAPQPDKRNLQDETYRDGTAYLLRAVEYLNAYASVSIFPLFFSSSLYADPASEKTNINDTLNAVFIF